jgi:hypothetical protein
MPTIFNMPQGSPEWYKVRAGVPTASMFHKIITPGGKPSAQARGYMHRLIAERVLNESMDDQMAVEWMEYGRAEQPNAAAQFGFSQDVQLEEVGFVMDDTGKLGCSPDALIVGKNESVEIKCPAPWTHIGYMLDGPGSDYKPQVQGQLLVGGFECVHLYSWNARCPPVHITTHRDEQYIGHMERLLSDFLEELEAEHERILRMGTFVPSMHVELPHERTIPGEEPVTNILGGG